MRAVMFGTILFFCMIIFCEGTFWETTGDVYERFQKIPPLNESKDKLMKYLLDRKNVPRSRRFVPYYDVVFCLDSSSTVAKDDFNLGITAAQKLVRRFAPDSHFSSITFAMNATINFNFTAVENAITKLGKIHYQGGKKNMLDALRTARNRLFLNRNSGVRMGSHKRVLLVTSGLPEEAQDEKQLQLFILAAFLLKTQGNEVFVVAVGERITRIEELILIPSSTDVHFYRVANMTQFKQMVEAIPEHILYQDKLIE